MSSLHQLPSSPCPPCRIAVGTPEVSCIRFAAQALARAARYGFVDIVAACRPALVSAQILLLKAFYTLRTYRPWSLPALAVTSFL